MNKKGVILLSMFMIMATLSAICAAFLYMSSVQSKAQSYSLDRAQAFWLAEAGIQRAIWKLKTPFDPATGAEGENWTTAGVPVTENLDLANGVAGSYTMEVDHYDFAQSDNGSQAIATASGLNLAANAIDNNPETYWESQENPSLTGIPQIITIEFPYPITINDVSFVPHANFLNNAPNAYSWQISQDNINYVIFTPFISNVRFLRLEITGIVGGDSQAGGVIIASLEVPGAKITSTGTIGAGTDGEINRTITQTVVVDDATRTAATQNDWLQE